MNANRYLRDRLPATRNQVCDPSCVVESRLALLADLPDGWSPNGPDQFAYDMLAALGWLQRTDLRLLTKLDPAGLVAAGRAYAGARGKELAERCWRCQIPKRGSMRRKTWRQLRGAHGAGGACRAGTSAHQRTRRCGAGAAGGHAAGHARRVTRVGAGTVPSLASRRCRCLSRGGRLCPGHRARPAADLDTVDPDLGRTAEKFAIFSTPWRTWRARSSPTGSARFRPSPSVSSWNSSGPHTAATRSNPRRKPMSFRFLLILLCSVNRSPSPRQAAGQPAGPIMATWRSPEHRLFAFLEIYSLPASNTEPVTITFFDSQDLPAVELVGQPVKLRDYSTTIKQSGANVVALVPWGNLPQLGESVRVGPDLTEWVAETAASSR